MSETKSVSRKCLRCGSGKIEAVMLADREKARGGWAPMKWVNACMACGDVWDFEKGEPVPRMSPVTKVVVEIEPDATARSPGPSGVGTNKIPDKVPSEPEPEQTAAKASSPAAKAAPYRAGRGARLKRARPRKRSGSG